MSAAITSLDAPTPNHRRLEAALRLHAHLAAHHRTSARLEGPDQGVRWNLRVWRFWRSYLPALSPRERHFFIQGQGYWALANWTLFDLTGDDRFASHAREASHAVATAQRADGAWTYPLRERRHLVATVEGNFGAVTMLAAHRRGLGEHFLDAARRWHEFVELRIGYQEHRGGLAVNYFDRPRGLVPNNTAEWIWVLGLLHDATSESRYLARVPDLLGFLEAVQLPNGELPYERPSPSAASVREHYLCYQYNAFQCMKLAWYGAVHAEPRARRLAERLAAFIAGGVTANGAVRASCRSRLPEVVYYADAVGMALQTVSRLGWMSHQAIADRAFVFVMSRQQPDGSFPFSRGDYYLLSDRNAYPRYLAMTLFHLAEHARPAP
ncbi:MAG TPA: hypothetical protein VEY91_01160 [Candidatus Limnocylindria bacterium]|nr:hypothetical protein [Candidatus Limnocylindria bacterium]